MSPVFTTTLFIQLYGKNTTFYISGLRAHDYTVCCLSVLLNLLEGILMFYLNTHSQLDHLTF